MKEIIAALFIALVIAIGMAGFFGWVLNCYKFVKLDFEAPYKAEAIRGIGVFTGFGAIIGYIDVGN